MTQYGTLSAFVLLNIAIVIILCSIPGISTSTTVTLLLLMSAAYTVAYNMTQHTPFRNRPDDYASALQYGETTHKDMYMPQAASRAQKPRATARHAIAAPHAIAPHAITQAPRAAAPRGQGCGCQQEYTPPPMQHTYSPTQEGHGPEQHVYSPEQHAGTNGTAASVARRNSPHHDEVNRRSMALDNVAARFGHPAWHDPIRNKRVPGADNPRRWEKNVTNMLQPLAGPREREPYFARETNTHDELFASRQFML